MGLVTFKNSAADRKKELKSVFVHLQYVLYRNIRSDSPMSEGDLLCHYQSWMDHVTSGHGRVITGSWQKFWQFEQCFFLSCCPPALFLLFLPSCFPKEAWRKEYEIYIYMNVKQKNLKENSVLAQVFVIWTRSGCDHKHWFVPCSGQGEDRNFFLEGLLKDVIWGTSPNLGITTNQSDENSGISQHWEIP